MNKPRLEITHRGGKPFAAYLYVDRDPLGNRADRTWRWRSFGVDYTRGGRVIGVEILDARPERLDELKLLLRELELDQVTDADLVPLANA
jgi:hypothetical protein